MKIIIAMLSVALITVPVVEATCTGHTKDECSNRCEIFLGYEYACVWDQDKGCGGSMSGCRK